MQTINLKQSAYKETSLDRLLVTVMAAMPFLPYVLSAAILIIVSVSVLVINQTRAALMQQKRMCAVGLGITAASLTGSLIYGNVIGLWITLGVFLILTFAAYVRTVMNKALFDRVITVSCFGTFLQLIAVVFEAVYKSEAVREGYRPVGFAYNANYLGSIAVLAAIFSLIALFENKSIADVKKNILKNIMYAASVLANCIILLICESRSSLLGLMAGAFVLLLLKKQYILCAIGAAGGIGIWVLGYFYPQMLGWTNSLIFVFVQRYAIWICALAHFVQNPLTALIGRGPMSYRFIWQNGLADTKWSNPDWLAKQEYLKIPENELAQYANDIKIANHAHNVFVDTLINVGIIGALLYIALLLGFVQNGLRKLKSGDKTAFIAVIVALTVILVQGIPDVTIMWHQTATLFVLLCAASFKEEK